MQIAQAARLALVVGAIAPLGFAPATTGQTPEPSSQASAIQQIANLRGEWAKTLHAKQLDAAMALYAEDAVFSSPDGADAVGKAQIRSLYEQVTRAFTSEITFESRSFKVSGSLAYDSGTYRETLTDAGTGAKVNLHGSYLMVLERGKDGTFRIVQHMWTNAPPEPRA